ncbi:MAG: tyrosine-type recombinase/integrase [Caldilineaceae bacterium]|nr:tyrosine-type recombinase/integrase [Caldilineaceae bacterium]
MLSADVGAIRREPRVAVLDARHLNWLIGEYIRRRRARMDNQLTVDGYEYQLRWFTDWWEAEGPPREWLLKPDDFVLFERYLRTAISPYTKRQIAYHTRATIIKRIKEMFRWAFDAGYVERDYTKWVPSADGGPPKRKAVGVLSLHQLLEVAGHGRDPLRDRAIVAMLMGMGLRRAEVSHLNVENVVVEADHSGHASVVGKRTRANKDGQRDAAFDCATGKIIVAYLDSIERSHGPLFMGQRGERLTGQGIYKVVKNAIARASLDEQIVGPHDLRRAFATHYRRSRPDKVSADLLRRQLGHASYSQTDEYTLLEVDDIRLDLVSPLSLFVPFDE